MHYEYRIGKGDFDYDLNWVSGRTYAENDRVAYEGKIYQALRSIPPIPNSLLRDPPNNSAVATYYTRISSPTTEQTNASVSWVAGTAYAIDTLLSYSGNIYRVDALVPTTMPDPRTRIAPPIGQNPLTLRNSTWKEIVGAREGDNDAFYIGIVRKDTARRGVIIHPESYVACNIIYWSAGAEQPVVQGGVSFPSILQPSPGTYIRSSTTSPVDGTPTGTPQKVTGTDCGIKNALLEIPPDHEDVADYWREEPVPSAGTVIWDGTRTTGYPVGTFVTYTPPAMEGEAPPITKHYEAIQEIPALTGNNKIGVRITNVPTIIDLAWNHDPAAVAYIVLYLDKRRAPSNIARADPSIWGRLYVPGNVDGTRIRYLAPNTTYLIKVIGVGSMRELGEESDIIEVVTRAGAQGGQSCRIVSPEEAPPSPVEELLPAPTPEDETDEEEIPTSPETPTTPTNPTGVTPTPTPRTPTPPPTPPPTTPPTTPTGARTEFRVLLPGSNTVAGYSRVGTTVNPLGTRRIANLDNSAYDNGVAYYDGTNVYIAHK